MIKDLAQAEEQVGEHKEEMTTDKNIVEDLEEDKDLIEDSEEDMIKDKDSTEAQGEDQIEDIEVENQSLMITIGTVWCAKREGTTTFLTAPSFQTIFPGVAMLYLSPKNYVNNASQPLAATEIVLTHTVPI